MRNYIVNRRFELNLLVFSTFLFCVGVCMTCEPWIVCRIETDCYKTYACCLYSCHLVCKLYL